jgi:hypothetical protein
MESSHISALSAKHATIDARIRTELCRPAPDSLLVAQLKKRKLRLKQEIAQSSG